MRLNFFDIANNRFYLFSVTLLNADSKGPFSLRKNRFFIMFGLGILVIKRKNYEYHTFCVIYTGAVLLKIHTI